MSPFVPDESLTRSASFEVALFCRYSYSYSNGRVRVRVRKHGTLHTVSYLDGQKAKLQKARAREVPHPFADASGCESSIHFIVLSAHPQPLHVEMRAISRVNVPSSKSFRRQPQAHALGGDIARRITPRLTVKQSIASVNGYPHSQRCVVLQSGGIGSPADR